MKEQLTEEKLIRVLESLLSREREPKEVADWAANSIWDYEDDALELADEHHRQMFKILINLIHNEDELFRLSDEELQGAIQALRS